MSEDTHLMDREPETAGDAISQAIFTNVDGKIPQDVVKELCHGHALQQARALKEQEELNKNQPVRGVDGVGQVRLRVTADIYYEAIANPVNRRLYGPNPWKNKEFLRKIAKKYPQLVPQYQPKATVVAPGLNQG